MFGENLLSHRRHRQPPPIERIGRRDPLKKHTVHSDRANIRHDGIPISIRRLRPDRTGPRRRRASPGRQRHGAAGIAEDGEELFGRLQRALPKPGVGRLTRTHGRS
ncbi:hypothetical protein BN844_4873 [Pseudomonas sp. SHC52]|nr:hypothetical protein BN844_4873 [Pseudomonas sp. SHC52]